MPNLTGLNILKHYQQWTIYNEKMQDIYIISQPILIQKVISNNNLEVIKLVTPHKIYLVFSWQKELEVFCMPAQIIGLANTLSLLFRSTDH